MKFVIIGKPGSGAPELVSYLTEAGLTACPLHTTRPKLKDGETAYAFLTEKDAAAIPPEDKLFLDVGENGAEYFLRPQDDPASARIIFLENPNMIKDLDTLVKDETCHLIHVHGGSLLDRKLQATRDTEKPLLAEQVFNQRNGELLSAFSSLEAVMGLDKDGGAVPLPMPKCITRGRNFEYDFNPENLEKFAKALHNMLVFHNRLMTIVKECGELGVLYHEDGKFLIAYDDPNNDKYVTADCFAGILMEDDEGMANIMREYVALSNRFGDMDVPMNDYAPCDEDAATENKDQEGEEQP